MNSYTWSSERRDWFYEDPPLVVQGKALGICPRCRAGAVWEEPTNEPGSCDGRCEGDLHYRFHDGPFYLGLVGEDEEWSCTDPLCVADWIRASEEFCGHCGSMVDQVHVPGRREEPHPRQLQRVQGDQTCMTRSADS